jgi:lactate 2-monooxygenase
MNFSALDWQRQIYLAGFSGRQPMVPVDFRKLELAAKSVMHPKAFAYVAGGAGNEETVLNNTSAFSKYKIVPRMLRNVSARDTSIELFGKKYATPFLLSPIGVLELVHPDADVAVARAASKLGIPYVFSNQASYSMERCAEAMNDSPRLFQLYWSKSYELVASFLKRAEAINCEAIVLTLDTTMLGWRTRDLDLSYLPFLEGKGIAQYSTDLVFLKMLEEQIESGNVKRQITIQSIQGLISMVNRFPGNGFIKKLRSGKPVKAVQQFISTYSNPSVTWDDLKFLRAHTKLPILLKGVLHVDDAQKAIDFGMDGLIVSNHGGRQVDGSIATIDALPGIIQVVQKRIPVLFDSGIRGGADAFKALALGATAICVGRPYVYGLALAGEEGVYSVLRNFMSDFELTMGLAGCKNISEINHDCLQL